MIHFRTFTGEFPRTPAHLLPEHAAQFSEDCDFTGVLSGIRERSPVPGIPASGLKSLFIYDSVNLSWYGWGRDVDAVRGPVANDAYNRFYWSDGTGVYVSRGDVGAGGEPSGENKYKAGVLRPTSAPTLGEEVTFSLPSISGISYELVCENADGTVTTTQAVTPVETSNTVSYWSGTVSTTGFSCATATSSTSGGTAATDIKEIGTVRPFISGTYLDFESQSFFGGYLLYGTGTGSELPYYAYMPDRVAVPVGDLFYGKASTSALDYHEFYHVGSGWYCTDASKPKPVFTPGITAQTAAAETMAVRMTFTKEAGGTVTGILRSSSSATTLPAEMSGITGQFTASGTTLTLTLNRSSDYVEARAYVITQVNQYGEEGPPSDALEVETAEGQAVSLNLPAPNHAGYCPVSKYRIYRTSGTTGAYLFVAEVAASAGTVVDSSSGEVLGEPLSTLGYLPPESGLKGLVSLPNGILAAFKDNEVHFSEPYLPYAWKSSNIMTTASRVIGLCAAEGGLFVTTTAHPYFISGMTPDAMSQTKITAVQAGVTKGSICNVGPMVVYASHDGLVMARGVDVSLEQSFRFFTRDEWRNRYASKLHMMRLNAHDGHLLCWFEDGTPGFLMRLDEVEPSFTRLTDPISAAFVHPQGDSLFLASGAALYAFKGYNSRKSFTWWSKEFITPKPVNFGALQLFGSGAVTIHVYADGSLIHTQAVSLNESLGTHLRLPSGFLARKWSIKLAGAASSNVTAMTLANSFAEMQGV